MRNGKEIVKLSRVLEFSFPILISLWLFFLCAVCFKLMMESKHSMRDLTDMIKLTVAIDYLETDNTSEDLAETELRKMPNLKPQHRYSRCASRGTPCLKSK